MKWRELRRSTNVEDVRGSGGVRGPVVAAGGLGLGGLILVLLFSVLTGTNPGDIIDSVPQQAPAPSGYVVPESFTHGSSAQRVEWFRRGLQTGDVNQCDTFGQ